MSSSFKLNQKFFGLLELEFDGTILYSRMDGPDAYRCGREVTGRNFFSEVAPFLNVEELRGHLETFSQGFQQANSMMFTCQYEDGPVPVKILMARVTENSKRELTKSILMHMRKI